MVKERGEREKEKKVVTTASTGANDRFQDL